MLFVVCFHRSTHPPFLFVNRLRIHPLNFVTRYALTLSMQSIHAPLAISYEFKDKFAIALIYPESPRPSVFHAHMSC